MRFAQGCTFVETRTPAAVPAVGVRPLLGTLASTLAIALLAAAASADTVVLQSGRSMSGEVVEETDEVVVLLVGGMGKVTFDRRDVKSVRRSGASTPPAGEQDPPPLRAAPPPPAREVPAEVDPQSPAGGGSPTSAAKGRAEARLAETVRFTVPDGPLVAALDRLSRETGLDIRLTPEARRLLTEGDVRLKSYTAEVPIAEFLRRMVNHTRGLQIEYRATPEGVLLGREHELFGAVPVTRGDSVHWADDRGDADGSFDSKGWTMPDLLDLSLSSEDGHLVFTLRFADDLARTLDQLTPEGEQKGYELATVYLDLDGDPTNGKPLSWDELRKGWECSVDVSTGFELRMVDSGSVFTQWGNIRTIAGTHEVIRSLTRYSIWKAGQTTSVTVDDSRSGSGPTADDLNVLDGATVVARIPYARLGLSPGQTIRACFVDSLQAMLSRGRVSQDAHLTLQ